MALIVVVATNRDAWAQDRAGTQPGGWSTEVRPATTSFTYETWGGIDGSATNWTSYTGFAAALYGDIRYEGWRIRLGGGYGRYQYSNRLFVAGLGREAIARFQGQTVYADAMLGYQHRIGPLYLKTYVGMTEIGHHVQASADSPVAADPDNAVQGHRRGVKGALETWLSVADWGFVQTDASWSEPFKTVTARSRIGYRVQPNWSAGPEAALYGNINHEDLRAGGFVRFEWASGEVSASAGLSGDKAGLEKPYGSINAFLRY